MIFFKWNLICTSDISRDTVTEKHKIELSKEDPREVQNLPSYMIQMYNHIRSTSSAKKNRQLWRLINFLVKIELNKSYFDHNTYSFLNIKHSNLIECVEIFNRLVPFINSKLW